MKNKEINLSDLKKEIPFHWRIQESKEFGTNLVAYIDSRDLEDLLDEVCGPENWCNNYTMAGAQMISNIGIKCGDEWIFKADGGTTSNIEKEKGLLSDSFKRAGIKWGAGRFLYRLKIIKLPSIKGYGDKWKPAHDFKKYGPVKDVPKGIMKWDFKEKMVSLEIKDVDQYVNKFLKPWAENQKVAK